MKKVLLGVLLIALNVSLFAGLPIGQQAPLLTLSGDEGGRVDGTTGAAPNWLARFGLWSMRIRMKVI